MLRRIKEDKLVSRWTQQPLYNCTHWERHARYMIVVYSLLILVTPSPLIFFCRSDFITRGQYYTDYASKMKGLLLILLLIVHFANTHLS